MNRGNIFFKYDVFKDNGEYIYIYTRNNEEPTYYLTASYFPRKFKSQGRQQFASIVNFIVLFL